MEIWSLNRSSKTNKRHLNTQYNYFSKMFYRSAIEKDFKEDELKQIQSAMYNGYGKLEEYLKRILIKTYNRKISVKATVLKDIELKPAFYKYTKRQYKYQQFKYRDKNETKTFQYNGIVYQLEKDYYYISDIKMNPKDMIPDFKGEYVELAATSFLEEEPIDHTPEISGLDNYHIKEPYIYSTKPLDDFLQVDHNEGDITFLLDKEKISHKVYHKNNKYYVENVISSSFFKPKNGLKALKRYQKKVLLESIDTFNDDEKDPLDYFFDDMEGYFFAELDSGENVRINVIKRAKDDDTIIIEPSDYEKTEEIKKFDSQSTFNIGFKLNTLNIKRQMKVFEYLYNYPQDYHIPLIKIAYNRSHFKKDYDWTDKLDYYFLVNTERNGTIQQREFVQKALSTPDFALLEGPPGSGKTTAILELIYQILRKDPDAKILLSSSTHVAIDNVIERIHDEISNLDVSIYPIRLGLLSNISEHLHEYAYEKLKESNEELAEQYLLSSNLVCGTTMGLVRYLENTIEFDYLIIDEASKTTLQEYIVPASFSKKHIIIGDVRQLAPYNDTQIIETLLNEIKSLKKHEKHAFYYHFLLSNMSKKRENKNNALLIIQNDVFNVLKLLDNAKHNYILITKENLFDMYQNKNIVMTEPDYLSYKEVIPNSFNLISEHHATHTFFGTNDFREYKELMKQSLKNHRDILKNRWAKELAWRIVRHYEMGKDENDLRQHEIKTLVPPSYKGTKGIIPYTEVEQLMDIIIPSIIVKLQTGLKTIAHDYNPVLNRGFHKDELKPRFVSLEYQHRMHPDISAYIENSIYHQKLRTARSVLEDRRSFPGLFPQRSLFVNVKNPKDCKNSNIQEAKEIIRVLDIIIRKMKDWDQKITIAILPFYRKQERNIFDELSKYLSTYWNKSIPSKHRNTIGNIEIVLFTVDRFQGYEADITLHSMCRNSRGVGFMNVPNRINVAFSRAKSYRIIIGDRDYYDKQKKHTHLRQMISYSTVYEEGALK